MKNYAPSFTGLVNNGFELAKSNIGQKTNPTETQRMKTVVLDENRKSRRNNLKM